MRSLPNLPPPQNLERAQNEFLEKAFDCDDSSADEDDEDADQTA